MSSVKPTGYWLLKSEPDTFSIDDLRRKRREPWDGVRNYQARNLIRDAMAPGQWALFYHSNAKPPGVVGLARIVSAPYPDPTQFDAGSAYYDPQSRPDAPRWYCADVEFVEQFRHMVPLHVLKDDPVLEGMLVLRRGQRLSVQPVVAGHFRHVLELAGAATRIEGPA